MLSVLSLLGIESQLQDFMSPRIQSIGRILIMGKLSIIISSIWENMKNYFYFRLSRIIEAGLNNRHYRNLLQESTLQCLASNFQKSTEAKELGLRDTMTAFSFIIGALISSFVIGFCEYFYFLVMKTNLKTFR